MPTIIHGIHVRGQPCQCFEHAAQKYKLSEQYRGSLKN